MFNPENVVLVFTVHHDRPYQKADMIFRIFCYNILLFQKFRPANWPLLKHKETHIIKGIQEEHV